jgi:AcrR family transcriptional regulator
MPPRAKPTTPVPGLSRARVCQEALALVDAEGLEALSMRRLGARLGVEAMSLYRHVRDKADLIDALHVAVLGDLRPEPDEKARPEKLGEAKGEDWRELLGGQSRALRRALLRHPNVVPLFMSPPMRAPEAWATVDKARIALIAAGFASEAAEQAIHVVGMFTIGLVLFEARSGMRKDATFRFGLESLLDGIAASKRAHSRTRGAHHG